jgi:transposase
MPRKESGDKRPIKTLEFKLYPNQSQARTLTDWLDRGRRVWNNGLAVLLEKDQQDWRKKAGFDPMEGNEAWQWFPNKVDGKAVFGACCAITAYNRRHNEHYPACSIRHPQNVDGAPRSVIYRATQLDNFCTRFKGGIGDDLLESWKAYKDKKRVNAKCPKFKGERFPLTSLSNGECTAKISGNTRIRFPLLGNIRTKGLERVPKDSKICTARICRKATGWYLQLAIRHDWPVPNVKMPDVAVAIDPGVRFATSTDYGRQVDAPKFLSKQIKKLRREQRKMSRRLREGGGVKGKNYQKQKAKVARLHETVARQRNAFWHKESTYFVTSFGGIAIEDNSFNNMGRKAKAKLREDGKGYARNNQAQKRGLNRSLKDVACGRLKVMVEAKAKTINNEVHLVRSHHNSQTCSNCGHVAKENRKSQSSFSCVACGHSMNADINAAINIHNRADWSNAYKIHPIRSGLKHNLHPHRLQVSNMERYPSFVGGIDESQKPASASHKSSNSIGGQQEGDSSPPLEITSESRSPEFFESAKIGKSKRGQKPSPLCQDPETSIQLSLWDLTG